MCGHDYHQKRNIMNISPGFMQSPTLQSCIFLMWREGHVPAEYSELDSVNYAFILPTTAEFVTPTLYFVLGLPFWTCLYVNSPLLPPPHRLVFLSLLGDGGMKIWAEGSRDVDGGCVELLSPWGAYSASPVPQINSQPASRALTSSLSLSLFLSPSISLSLSARGTCCPHVSFLRQPPVLLPTVHVCLATSLPSLFCLLLCMAVSLSPLPPVLLSVCFCVCASVCVHGCLPVHLPVCLPATLSSQYLSGGKRPGCQPLCQSARLSACLLVICLCLCLSACAPICLLTCLHVHLFAVHLGVLLVKCWTWTLTYSNVAGGHFNFREMYWHDRRKECRHE